MEVRSPQAAKTVIPMEAVGGPAPATPMALQSSDESGAEPVAFLWGLWAWADLHGGYK